MIIEIINLFSYGNLFYKKTYIIFATLISNGKYYQRLNI